MNEENNIKTRKDLITEEELQMLEDCQIAKEWGEACIKIKGCRGGEYPEDWWHKVSLTGMMDRIAERWGGGGSTLTVETFNKNPTTKPGFPTGNEMDFGTSME